MLLKDFFNNISQLQPLGMQSLAGEAGAAQTDVERLFAQCPIMRNGNPGLILPPARQRVDLRSEPSCFGQRRPRSIEVAVERERPGEPHMHIPISRPLSAHPLE